MYHVVFSNNASQTHYTSSNENFIYHSNSTSATILGVSIACESLCLRTSARKGSQVRVTAKRTGERILVSCTSPAFFLSPSPLSSRSVNFPTRKPTVESDCCAFPPNVRVVLVGVWLHLMGKTEFLWTVKFSKIQWLFSVECHQKNAVFLLQQFCFLPFTHFS